MTTEFTIPVLLGPLVVMFVLTLVHVFVWRTFAVKKQIFCLFFIFLGAPLLSAFTVFFIGLIFAAELPYISILASVVLYLSLAVVYVQTFPAIQARSPSLLILSLPHLRSTGLNKGEIINELKNVSMFSARLEDLENDGFAFRENSELKLKTPGKILAMFFYYYRKCLKLPLGSG